MQPGDYGYWRAFSHWIALSPNGKPANLAGHDVIEHADGTITVSPSIGIRAGAGFLYHGYLERGIWREC